MRYRVVSDRREYGVYESYYEAYMNLQELVCYATCYYSNEDFWIVEE